MEKGDRILGVKGNISVPGTGRLKDVVFVIGRLEQKAPTQALELSNQTSGSKIRLNEKTSLAIQTGEREKKS